MERVRANGAVGSLRSRGRGRPRKAAEPPEGSGSRATRGGRGRGLKRKRGRPPHSLITPVMIEPEPVDEPMEVASPGVPERITRLLQDPIGTLPPGEFFEKDPLEEDLGMESSSGTQSETEAMPIGAPDPPLPDLNVPDTLSAVVQAPIKRHLTRLAECETSSTTSSESGSAESSQTNSRTSSPVVRGGRGRGRGRPRGRAKASRLVPDQPINGQRLVSDSHEVLRRFALSESTQAIGLPAVETPPAPLVNGCSDVTPDDRQPVMANGCETAGVSVTPDSPSLSGRRRSLRTLRSAVSKSVTPITPPKPDAPEDNDVSSDEPLVPIQSAASSSALPNRGALGNRQARVCLAKLANEVTRVTRSAPVKPAQAYPTEIKMVAVSPVLDINLLPEVQKEIKGRLKTFNHIKENQFLCERKFNKQSKDMECDCTISKEDVAKGAKGCGEDCLNRLLMIECNKTCALGKLCGNRKFQQCANTPVEIFKTQWKGIGLRAKANIGADEFIMEYVGEVLDMRQFRKRAKRYAKNDVKHFYFMALSAEYCIDATCKGNISRFINHSCDPNAETQKWTVNGELRVGFFTKKRVQSGEELTFDYKYERYGQEAQKCYCGSANCRGWLGGEPDCDDDDDEEDEEEEEEDYWSSSSEEEEEIAPPKESPILEKAESSDLPEPTPAAKPVHKIQQKDAEFVPLEDPREKIPVPSKRRKRRKRRSPRKIKNYEEEQHDEEIERLKQTGIRTKSHTVDVCRLMVRTTDPHTRTTIAKLIKQADSPCRRLFLDYNGLKLLQGWASELRWSLADLHLKLAVEDVLASLSFPHRTMLMESKMWRSISNWAVAKSPKDDLPDSPPRFNQSNREHGEDSEGTPVKQLSKALSFDSPKYLDSIPIDSGVTPNKSEIASVEDVDVHSQDIATPPPGEEGSLTMFQSSDRLEGQDEEGGCHRGVAMPTSDSWTSLSIVNPIVNSLINIAVISVEEACNMPRVKPDLGELDDLDERHKMHDMAHAISSHSQAVESKQDSAEVMDEHMANELDPVSKPKAEEASLEKQSSGVVTDDEILDAQQIEKIELVRRKAQDLLDEWNGLKEVFKIPKRELNQLRAKHEEEADQAAAKYQHHGLNGSIRDPSQAPSKPPFPAHSVADGSNKYVSSSYDRSSSRVQTLQRPDSPTRRERRISRFDDQSGLLHLPNSEYSLSRSHRRQLFRLRAETETKERERRLLLQQQHENKCYYLHLDASLTPMFPQYPEYFLDDTGQWSPMPAPFPEVEVTWGYAKMALLPLDAFLEEDPPLPNPSFYYPPGVVEVSYLYGMPPEPVIEAEIRVLLPTEPPPPLPPLPQTVRLPDQMVPFLNSQPVSEIPFLRNDSNQPLATRMDLDSIPHPEPRREEQHVLPTAVPTTHVPISTTSRGQISNGQSIVIRLPPKWRSAKSADGRTYFYNSQTKETRWDPPIADDDGECSEDSGIMAQMETASTDSEDAIDRTEEDGDTDDEDEEEDDDEEDETSGTGKSETANKTDLEIVSSDLSAQEKELLLTKKKSREERRHERRQKRERDREKREYERKRRRERHGRHRKAGLVQEHLIPKRTDKDKMDLMTFNEIKERLANRDSIREAQELEERAEAEKDREIERAKRSAEAAAVKPKDKQVAVTPAGPTGITTTAPADTSTEVAKKIKDRFTSDVSRVIVKVLTSFRQDGTKKGPIKSKEDFKHLAKKLTHYIMSKEQKHCTRIEDLRCSDSVKKKTTEYVKKYMLKFGDAYKRSPPQPD